MYINAKRLIIDEAAQKLLPVQYNESQLWKTRVEIFKRFMGEKLIRGYTYVYPCFSPCT